MFGLSNHDRTDGRQVEERFDNVLDIGDRRAR
jgi:hypothetical protein